MDMCPVASTHLISLEPDLSGRGGGAVRHGIWRVAMAATAGAAWIHENRDQITREEEDLLEEITRKGRNRVWSGGLASSLTSPSWRARKSG
jgi:hypothetical protein